MEITWSELQLSIFLVHWRLSLPLVGISESCFRRCSEFIHSQFSFKLFLYVVILFWMTNICDCFLVSWHNILPYLACLLRATNEFHFCSNFKITFLFQNSWLWAGITKALYNFNWTFLSFLPIYCSFYFSHILYHLIVYVIIIT